MDGPPALTLGLESASKNLMRVKPVKRNASIVSKGMLFRIIFNAIFIGTIMILQERLNFLGAKQNQRNNASFTLFIVFQLFNAFNSRELGERSIFSSIGKNRVMLLTFLVVFLLQVLISQVFPSLFGLEKMEFVLWLKIICLSSSIILVTELAKAVYRLKIHKKIIFVGNRSSKIKSS
jgi:Ca2+-transporting ATPase